MGLRHGFVLTRHWRDTASGIEVDFWLATDDGPQHVRKLGSKDTLQPAARMSLAICTISSCTLSLSAGLIPVICRCRAARQYSPRPMRCITVISCEAFFDSGALLKPWIYKMEPDMR